MTGSLCGLRKGQNSSNATGSDQHHAEVTLEPPRFTAPLQDTFFRVREALALEVHFSGSQHISVTWKKDNKLIWASYKYNVKTTDTSSRLEVLNADREEAAGIYSCEISNSAGATSCSATIRLEPPRFTRRLCNSSYKLGRPLTLQCEFVGSQRLYVSWKKDGKPIWASYKYNVKTTGRSSALEILNCDSRDAIGKYSCEVENSVGSAVCHCLVCVEPVSFTTPLHDTTYCLGGALSLPVGFLGSPPVFVSWRKDGKPIWASYKYNVKRTLDSCELQVLNADREEAQGEYVCEISNSENTAQCYCNVTLEPVHFTRPLSDCSFSVGQPLSLSVGFSGSPRVHVSWTKDGKAIWASYKYNIKRTDRTCELQVLNADREEAKGHYSCCISNNSSQAECSAEVTLKPVRIICPLLDISYALGKPLFLEVGFSGSQRIHLSWTKDDKPIWASYKYNMTTTPTSCRLQILNSDREEAQGRYCVTVGNSSGTVRSDTFVLCQTNKKGPPKFVRNLENCTYRLGEKLSLSVAFRAGERVSVSWRKDGNPIWASYKYNVRTTDCSCILDVLNADREEARGRYSCEISNKDGSDTCHADVTLEPVRFVQKLRNVTHKLGRPLTLVCTYQGSENVHATWKKDGKLIWASYQYNTRISKGRCELDVLNNDRKIAAGKYSCEIANLDGSDCCECLVQIGNTDLRRQTPSMTSSLCPDCPPVLSMMFALLLNNLQLSVSRLSTILCHRNPLFGVKVVHKIVSVMFTFLFQCSFIFWVDKLRYVLSRFSILYEQCL